MRGAGVGDGEGACARTSNFDAEARPRADNNFMNDRLVTRIFLIFMVNRI
jgi:hypothetical protein